MKNGRELIYTLNKKFPLLRFHWAQAAPTRYRDRSPLGAINPL